MNPVKRVVLTAVCAALGVVLPMAFHAIPNAGSIWLPMHIPVLLCGLAVGPVEGLVAGILAPLFSSLLTGLPPMAFLPSMLCEIALSGLVAGALARVVADLYASLVGAMLAGRIVGGVLQALIFSAGGYSLAAWATSYFVTGVPGIVLQLVAIVPIVAALERGGLIPARYPKTR